MYFYLYRFDYDDINLEYQTNILICYYINNFVIRFQSCCISNTSKNKFSIISMQNLFLSSKVIKDNERNSQPEYTLLKKIGKYKSLKYPLSNVFSCKFFSQKLFNITNRLDFEQKSTRALISCGTGTNNCTVSPSCGPLMLQYFNP